MKYSIKHFHAFTEESDENNADFTEINSSVHLQFDWLEKKASLVFLVYEVIICREILV